MINQIVSHYRILKKLGEGGMGEVYLAEDITLPRKVAIKFLSVVYASHPDFKARFKHEAYAAASISHPNVITIHEVGEFEGRPYIVMEYVEGESLDNLIARKELQVNEVIDIGIQICEGLKKAHQKGVLHRDIKPTNILIDTDGLVKIVDFGLAKLRHGTTITVTGTLMGTVSYMSPEQALGKNLDQRSDIFSLGVVLYELITRQRPFNGETAEAIRYAIIKEEPEPLARYKRGVSASLQSIIDRALDKDRETRYQNMDGLLADLKREKKIFLSSLPPTVTIPPIRARKRQTRKRWYPLLAFSAFFVVLLAVLAYYLPRGLGRRIVNLVVSEKVPVSISTEPDGATVFLNGDSIGVTPLNFPTAADRRISLRFKKLDYFTLDTSVVVKKGQAETFSFPLQPAARVAIVVDPAEAEVSLDGKIITSTQLASLQLPVGRHNISISYPGYDPQQDQFTLVQGDNPPRRYSLKKKEEIAPPPEVGGIRITSVPPGASLSLNGKTIGRTTYEDQQIKPGSYKLLIRQEGYQDFSQTISVRSGQTTQVEARLTKLVLGKLAVLVKPSGAIYIDGRLHKENAEAQYTTDLPPGSYRIRIENPSLGRWEKVVEIEPDRVKEIAIDFDKMVQLTVTAFDTDGKPVRAEIFVDNQATGLYTPRQLALRIGQHTIAVRREGYELVGGEQLINLEEDLKLKLTLKKIE
jgi:serine/threonine protein kinase